MRCSYGYRPNLSARDAVRKLTVKLQFGKYHHVADADIKGFFDNMDHDWLSRRSQRGQISWEKMKRLTERFKLVGPSINEKGGRRKVKKVCFYQYGSECF